MTAPAQSNDRPRAVSTEQLCAQIQRWLHTHTIKPQTSPAGTGDLVHPFGRFRATAVVHDVVRVEHLGLMKLVVVDVSGDDAYGGEHAEQLNRHVSETADTKNDHGAVRVELRQRARDGVSAASLKGAACAGFKSPSGTSTRADGTSMYSRLLYLSRTADANKSHGLHGILLTSSDP